MYRSILFDLDGTLLNTIDDISNSMNRALKALGLKQHDIQSYYYFVGNGIKVLSQRATGKEHPELWSRVAELYQEDYSMNNAVFTKPYNGIVPMLKVLNEKRIPVVVLSNKPHVDTQNVIKHYFPDIEFAIVRGQMEGIPVKPDPTAALDVTKQLHIAPSDFLYVGDTDVDMKCANAAGMNAIGVTWGFRKRDELEESGAKLIVNTPNEILKLI